MTSEANLFSKIDARRRESHIGVTELVMAAKVGLRTWERFRSTGTCSSQVYRRLDAALDQLCRGVAAADIDEAEMPVDLMAGTVQCIGVILCDRLGFDAPTFLGLDFTSQKPLNKLWLEGSRIRRTAIHIAVTELGLSRVDVARATRCTRQNVKQAIDATEALMDREPAMAALVERVGELVKPRLAVSA